MGVALVWAQAWRSQESGDCPRDSFLRVPGPIFQSIGKYCKNNLRGGKAQVGCGWEEPRDELFLMFPSLTDLQGVDNPTDVLFWNQCMVELESTDVIRWDVCSCQGLRDLGYNPTLVESQGLSSYPQEN